MSMTEQRQFAHVEIVGGEFDGYTIRVPYNEDGSLPETWVYQNFGPPNYLIPPDQGAQGSIMQNFLELDWVTDPDTGERKPVYRATVQMLEDLNEGRIFDPTQEGWEFGGGRAAA